MTTATAPTSAAFNLRKCPGNNPDYEVIERTPSGGFRIGDVYPDPNGEWSGSCSYADTGFPWRDNLLGVRFESKEAAGAAVHGEKARRKAFLAG